MINETSTISCNGNLYHFNTVGGPKGPKGPKAVPDSNMNNWEIDAFEMDKTITEILTNLKAYKILTILVIKVSGYFSGRQDTSIREFQFFEDEPIDELIKYINDIKPTDIVTVSTFYYDKETFVYSSSSRTIMSEDAKLKISIENLHNHKK